MKKLNAPLSAFILSTPRWLESSRSISRIMASRLEASAPNHSSCSSAPARRAAKTAAIYADAYHAAISDNMNLVARIVGTGRRQDVLLDVLLRS